MALLSSKTGLPSFSQSITEINYFTDGGFERGTNGQAPADWVQYNDGAVAIPVDGTGGTAQPLVTMLVSNSSPIRGTLSAIISKDAANRQGIGYSYPFTISPADKGITSGVSFEMQTSLNFASGDVVFYVYDVTNSLLITPRNTSLTKMDNYGKFFSDFALTSGTQYRFILHIATVNALAWTLKLDTMVNTTTKTAVPGTPVGRIPITATVIGATNSLAYTNTIITNCVGVQVESWLEVTGKLSFTGLPTTGIGALVVRVSTSGLTLDSTKAQNWTGSGAFYDASAAGAIYNILSVPYMTGTNLDIQFPISGDTASTATLIPATVPVAFANGDLMTFSARIPILEWAGASANFIRPNVQSPIRAGTVQAFAGSVTPAGWLDCDGTSKLIIDYPELYAQIGTTWATCTNPLTGVANSAPAAGSFRVPDLRGAFMRGAGGPNAAGVTTSLAGFQADTTAKNGLSVTNGLTSSDGVFGRNAFAAGTGGYMTASADNVNPLVATASQHQHTSNTTLNLGDAETRPDNVGLRMIIKAWDESFNPVGFGAATATQQGLVSGGTVPGSTSGAAIGAGYIGEKFEQNWAGTSASSGSYVDVGTQQTLGAGTWLVNFSNSFSLATGGTQTSQHGARLVIDGVIGSTYGKDFAAGGLVTANQTGALAAGTAYVSKSAPWTLKAQAGATFSGAAGSYYGSWTAIRTA